MVNCKQAVEQLVDFLERNLSPDARDAIVSHMKDCPACVTFVETYCKTSSLCREAMLKAPPEGLTDRILAHVREHVSSKS